MAEAKLLLERAFRSVIAARSEADRQAAADDMIAKLKDFVVREPYFDWDAHLQQTGARTRELLGDRARPVSCMTDAELREFNASLPWVALTSDINGRLVGQAYSADKRGQAHGLIDGRQRKFFDEFSLKNPHVLELGCFEGIHSIGLLLLGARVTAVDGRLDNVLKTLARVWAYGMSCDVQLWDVEIPAKPDLPESWDVLHHVGVLYHLANPVEHLDFVLPKTKRAVLLDTHVANNAAAASQKYEIGGRTFRYLQKPEAKSALSPFAGMKDHAKYLVLEELVELFRSHGFSDTRVPDDRMERNGRRITLWAARP